MSVRQSPRFGSDSEPLYDLVIPTIGRPCLAKLLVALFQANGTLPGRLVLVDDRPEPEHGLNLPSSPSSWANRVQVIQTRGRGPAAARNAGWRLCTAQWIAFLDDDVVPPNDWLDALVRDLKGVDADVGATQGQIRVPLPHDRLPTDWERNVQGLEVAQWATADMAYRRRVLIDVDGFDERFGRAYREDSDLGLRVSRTGHRIVRGELHIVHPVRPADSWVSVRMQKGNADDALMRQLHGPSWRQAVSAGRGRFPWHVATVVAALVSLTPTRLRRFAMATWALLTLDFARRRIMPGPKTYAEIRTMLLSSIAIPFVALSHRLRGELRWRRSPAAVTPQIDAVLFDRDATLVVDVPYNGDPEKVELMPGAREALANLRESGLRIGVVSNQSGVARGLITEADVAAVNRRIEDLLGPVDVFLYCPHAPEDLCGCRKPAPGMIFQAADALGVAPKNCVVVGDIESDVLAARAAGARAVLVPTKETLPEEVDRAPVVCENILAAANLVSRGFHD